MSRERQIKKGKTRRTPAQQAEHERKILDGFAKKFPVGSSVVYFERIPFGPSHEVAILSVPFFSSAAGESGEPVVEISNFGEVSIWNIKQLDETISIGEANGNTPAATSSAEPGRGGACHGERADLQRTASITDCVCPTCFTKPPTTGAGSCNCGRLTVKPVAGAREYRLADQVDDAKESLRLRRLRNSLDAETEIATNSPATACRFCHREDCPETCATAIITRRAIKRPNREA